MNKIELPQVDGIPVKEKIIRFFERGIDRKNAEMLYARAEKMGEEGGTNLFDKAIDLICDGLDLNSAELSNSICGTN